VRDRIRLPFPDPLELPGPLEIERPTDLADEPGRLETSVPLLAEHLPPEAPARILVFRCGYGLLPLLVLRRYPRSEVLAVDRDLLATAFTRRNCAASGEGAPRLRVEEAVGLGGAASCGLFDLVLGELSSPLGERANAVELSQARSALAPGGRGLVLASKKQWKEWLRPRAELLRLNLREARGTAALIEIGAS